MIKKLSLKVEKIIVEVSRNVFNSFCASTTSEKYEYFFDVEHEKLTKLDNYIDEERVQQFLVSIIKECFSKESEMKIKEITTIDSKLRINLEITMSLLNNNLFTEKFSSIKNLITDSIEV